ncbi:MAG: cytochrome B6 [Dolichospermum sp. JUN01]|nr:cytochrome B6 [Dolichospermum sp. JUN01]MBS9395023.1 cytochrome B6 [Dolichospermum sp. OL01]MCO5798650.1 cytochrome B6 [Dolichospermum sp. OL03]MCS6283098.1 cytochrome B6 [Dolichospermum sp.]QSV60074.1 MAG: cytochrome B6 [Dolichospermum sp. LBC05a]
MAVVEYIVFLGVFMGVAVGLLFGLRGAKVL